jgi:acyl-CoA oxidase
MLIAGLPEIVASLAATCTFEGENYVMWQQVAKYLMKGMEGKKSPEDMKYVERYRSVKVLGWRETNNLNFMSKEVLVEIFENRAARLTIEAHGLVKESLAEGKPRAMVENKHALPLLAAARAHIELYILTSSFSFISTTSTSHPSTPPSTVTALTRLIILFGLSTICSPFSLSSSFLEDGSISHSQITSMRQHVNDFLDKLLPDAVALTDAWNFSDASLASAIGCKDGNVYWRVMGWVRQLEINIEAKKDGGVFKNGFEKHIKPVLMGDDVKARL